MKTLLLGKSISLLILIPCLEILSFSKHITYQKHGGRFGDCLINFLKCQYLAKKYQMRLLYRPFKYSDAFVLHTQFHPLESSYQCIHLDSENQLKKMALKDKVYESHYFTALLGIHGHDVDSRITTEGLYDYALAHPSFHEDIRHLLTPITPPGHLAIPTDCLTIAVHVRKGTGWDSPMRSVQFYQRPSQLMPCTPPKGYADTGFPTKFPPDQYYVDQIKVISEALGNPPLYIHLFTDDPNPTELVKQYTQALNKSNIIFGWRKEDNHHTKNVIDDFFNMAFDFNILIRSSSSFSWMAQFIGNHICTIAPLHGLWHQNMLIIDQVELIAPNYTNGQVNRYRLDLLPPKDKIDLLKKMFTSKKVTT